jgi:hemolysin III
VLHSTLGAVILITARAAARVGAVSKLIWIDAPGLRIAIALVSIGWIALIVTLGLVDRLAIAVVGSLALGGILDSVEAVVYARKRPDPGRRCSATTSCVTWW